MTQNGYQHMVLDHYVSKVRAMREERQARLDAVKTPADAQAYQEHVRLAIERAFAPRPDKTPLNTQVTGTIEREACRIEKLTFESRPGCLVTANLYLPADLDAPAPAVVAPCGHSNNGKACDLYSGFCQRLALNGFVALIYDPFNQGERDQYHELSDRDCVAGCCAAHNMMGKQLELLGEYFGMWRVWDGMRALDVLLERPEVDPTHVGVTGNSGGGTLSEWLWATEYRLTMAAPSCFVTTFLNNLENELPADCEQYPPGVMGAGLDMADFMIARAPLPALLLGQKYDYFDRRGLQTTHGEMRRVYDVLGAEDKAALFIGPQGHGYSIHNQEAMVEFFCRHAGMGEPVRISETEVIPDEELAATPDGNVIAAGATPIYTLIADKADRLAAQRQELSTDGLKQCLTGLLNLPAERPLCRYRIPRPVSAGGKVFARYAVETEGHIRAILRKRMAEDQRAYAGTLDVEASVTLVLPHVSAQEDMTESVHFLELNAPQALYGLDVRGLGESMPEPHGAGGFFQPYGMDYMLHGQGVLFGESYLGRRVHDVLCVLDLLVHEGAQHVKLYGRGQGALLALFAALLHEAVSHTTLINAPLSYHEWCHAPLVAWPSANFLRGALRHLDLPDCIRALGAHVTVVEPWGVDMQPTEDAATRD